MTKSRRYLHNGQVFEAEIANDGRKVVTDLSEWKKVPIAGPSKSTEIELVITSEAVVKRQPCKILTLPNRTKSA